MNNSVHLNFTLQCTFNHYYRMLRGAIKVFNYRHHPRFHSCCRRHLLCSCLTVIVIIIIIIIRVVTAVVILIIAVVTIVTNITPCEQSLSKTHQRACKRGSAEIVPRLLSHRSPSFWASHVGQTGFGSSGIIFLTRRRSKSSLQLKNQYGVRSAIET